MLVHSGNPSFFFMQNQILARDGHFLGESTGSVSSWDASAVRLQSSSTDRLFRPVQQILTLRSFQIGATGECVSK